jgi:predicted DNA-binding antitoxin AbrB/MazE fold protein
MSGTIRAKVKNGLLEPLERIDLPEGTEVAVTILGTTEKRGPDAFVRAAGSWKGKIDAEEFIHKIYTDRLISTRPEPLL